MAYSNITLTTQTGLSFITGEFIQLIHDSNNYMFGQIVSYNPSTGSLTFTPTRVIGSGTYSTWEVIASGAAGNDGTSGTSGINGTSGTSGATGTSGASGTSGTSGTDGTSGSSGINGTSGTSGLTGTSGTSGVNGTSGVSGTSGTSGVDGASGTSGVSGTSGTSGVNGTSGTAGTSGTSVSVSGTAGYVTYFNSSTTVTGSSNLFWDSTNNYLAIGNPATRLAQLHVYNASAAASFLLQTNSTTDYSEIAVRNNSSTATSYFRQYSTAATGSDFGITRAGLALFFSNYATNFAIGTRNGGDLIFGTADTERARILASNGNFGIGTSSPSYLLDVNGTGRFSGAVKITTGTDGIDIGAQTGNSYRANAIFRGTNASGSGVNGYTGVNVFSSDGSMDIAVSGSNAIKFYPSGSLALTLASTGAATFSSSVTATTQGASNGFNTGGLIAKSNGNTSRYTQVGYDNSGNYGWIQAIEQGTAYTNLILNGAGGNVGIGTTTPLQTTANRTVLTVNGTNQSIVNLGYSGTLGGYFYADAVGAEIYSAKDLLVTSSGAYSTLFYTNGSERMRITSGGALKISNGAPPTSGDGLEIFYNGTSLIGSYDRSTSTYKQLYFYASNTIFENGGSERMRITSGGDVGIGNTAFSSTRLTVTGKSTTSSDFSFVANNSSNNNLFLVRNDGTHIFQQGGGTETMRITSGGNVLIGTTTSVANYAMDISGNNGAIWGKCGNSGDAQFISASTTIGFHYYALTTGAVFYVLTNGDVRNANNSYGAISDISLKENITDATPKLADLLKVKVRNYNLIADEKKEKQIGVIAQELEEIFPNMITEDKLIDSKETIKTVKYSVFVPMLIKAIQELKAEIDELKNK